MPSSPARRARLRGFTLIELLVAMVIVAILGTIALASYRNQVYKSRRAEAKTALLDLAGREERNLSATNGYSSTASQLGYTGAFPVVVGSGYYQVTATVPDPNQPAPGAGQPPSFLLTATAVGDQVSDTNCATYTVNNLGQQRATSNTGADQSTTCW
ncbi:MAG: prepilin-type N-terminal cleavage/methylation domain-containing protein [Proteobacteria bacterium]|nr:prepilin-type N-terminal cleavage/methylation domain-containing protein [Pseudomonadota bacterium]